MDSHFSTDLRNLFYHRLRNARRNFLIRVLVFTDDLLFPQTNKNAILLYLHISD
jgi:hypothetical protein